MNRLAYDTCSYVQELNQSVSPLSYTLDTSRFEHCNKCRPELGIVGGTAVSHIAGNLVDLENDLRGGNRPMTRCPEYKYLPRKNKYVRGKEYIKPVCHRRVDTTPVHLKPCQMQSFPGIPATPPVDKFSCKFSKALV
jgi:hypothetical protein